MIKVSKYNSEGYYDPTAYEGMSNVLREEAKKESLARKRRSLGLPFMPKVFICSPYAGDIAANTEKAIKYCRFAVNKGYIPFAPHLFFPRFLSESCSFERTTGIIMGTVFLDSSQEIWVFGDRISEGMEIEIKRAQYRKLRIRYFTEGLKEVSGDDISRRINQT